MWMSAQVSMIVNKNVKILQVFTTAAVMRDLNLVLIGRAAMVCCLCLTLKLFPSLSFCYFASLDSMSCIQQLFTHLCHFQWNSNLFLQSWL